MGDNDCSFGRKIFNPEPKMKMSFKTPIRNLPSNRRSRLDRESSWVVAIAGNRYSEAARGNTIFFQDIYMCNERILNFSEELRLGKVGGLSKKLLGLTSCS